jgi:predicted transcriptional regulator
MKNQEKEGQKPTESELEILRLLWAQGPSTVRQVHEALLQQRDTKKDVVYTTTLKTLQNMYDKRLVGREEAGRGHSYHALVSEESVQTNLIDKLLDAAFGGSAMKLVMQLLGKHQASPEELQAIRKLLEEKGKQ